MINFNEKTANLDEMTGEELREIALGSSDDSAHEHLREEDYTAVIDFELSLKEPDSKVMAFCHKGLCRYEAYAKDAAKPDISELMKKAGLISENGSVKTFSILDLKTRSMLRADRADKNARILKDALRDRLHDTYEKEGITFIITNSKGHYNLSWLNKDMLYNINNNLSLSDVNEFIGSYAA